MPVADGLKGGEAVDVQSLEKAKQQWQTAADTMPQLICLLNARGQLIHVNRAIERWRLGQVDGVKGKALHDVLHPGCGDPACYFQTLWLDAAAGLDRGERTECEVYDPVLMRHFSILVQPLVRPSSPLRDADDLHAVMMMGDISDFKQAEAGYQRLYQELECLACLEKERRELSEGMQARLLTILERTTDYIAMADADGGMLYLNPAGRTLLGLSPEDDISRMNMSMFHYSEQGAEEKIRGEAIPSAIRNGLWTGESRLRDRDGREVHASQVIIAHPGDDGQTRHVSTILRDTSEQVRTAQILRESHEELHRLSGLLVTIQEDERRRIALDLHDGLGQSLSLIKLSIENAAGLLAAGEASEASESLQQLIPRVREALVEVRRVSTELRPSILDDLGILPTLSWFFRELEAACSHLVVEKAFNVAEHEVPAPLQITLYRIVQEATNNIVKHAGADRVRVSLDRIDQVLHLLIEDNGCGFDPASIRCVEGEARGLGLLSMKERASFSGGVYRIVSAPGQGTRIEVSWPCGPATG
ncbi:MAG TPA: PAS domain S-box protein [Thiobacillus sp.]|nr:PAS domain S-box protein [Thiobacillus sp.]